MQCACRGTYDPFFSEDELSGYNSAWSSRGLSSHNLKKAPEGDAYTGSRSYLYSGAPSKQVIIRWEPVLPLQWVPSKQVNISLEPVLSLPWGARQAGEYMLVAGPTSTAGRPASR
jgi:hypothetical protein